MTPRGRSGAGGRRHPCLRVTGSYDPAGRASPALREDAAAPAGQARPVHSATGRAGLARPTMFRALQRTLRNNPVLPAGRVPPYGRIAPPRWGRPARTHRRLCPPVGPGLSGRRRRTVPRPSAVPRSFPVTISSADLLDASTSLPCAPFPPHAAVGGFHMARESRTVAQR